ncbi:hypothetical protein jhhlp_003372 [Lomentospora prolificans]|uniref:Heme haloperoxidase family profile domain-containing protein n=1 Tax=Lomentospora prolificans TaxID=41688 RepID=A0A2N3NCA9_9PEZI|nr:hypothetical protein jhhlp_003372 [Lomentospora prolificans]
MKSTITISLTAIVTTAFAAGSDPFAQWQGPKAGDARGPCPFMNSFANHGFLPRSGKYITEQNLIDGLFEAVHFEEALSQALFRFAITTNPEPNSTWFSLDHLARHNVLEHDASLSRLDAFFGHGEVFSQETFDQTRSYWGDIIDAESGVNAILARLETSNATNPKFSLSAMGEGFLLAETGAFISVLGDSVTLTANKTAVEYLFEKERLPTELGWKRRDTAFTQEELNSSMDRISGIYEERLNRISRKKPRQANRFQ